MDRLKTLITSAIVLFMIGFFVWAMLPKDDFSRKFSEKLNKDKTQADIVFKVATFSEIYDGIKYWELVAQSSSINKSVGKADLKEVDGLFFDKGKPTLKFVAPTADWNIKKNEILLYSPIGYDVKYESSIKDELAKAKKSNNNSSVFHLSSKYSKKAYKGFWFQSKTLDWRLATKMLRCTGPIILTKDNVIINAGKLEADVGLENVKLTDKPSAEITANKDKIVIHANTFYVDNATDTMTATDNVRIFRGGSRIKTGKAVYYQKNETIELLGDVYITDDKVTAFAKSALYKTLDKLVVLKDNAKAKRDNNEIYGKKMTIMLGQNKIIVEGRTKATIKEMEFK